MTAQITMVGGRKSQTKIASPTSCSNNWPSLHPIFIIFSSSYLSICQQVPTHSLAAVWSQALSLRLLPTSCTYFLFNEQVYFSTDKAKNQYYRIFRGSLRRMSGRGGSRTHDHLFMNQALYHWATLPRKVTFGDLVANPRSRWKRDFAGCLCCGARNCTWPARLWASRATLHYPARRKIHFVAYWYERVLEAARPAIPNLWGILRDTTPLVASILSYLTLILN